MRTIEFRGKRFGNGCWVYGYLVENETAWDDYNGYQLPTEYEIGIVRTDVCIREFIKIDVDTVCQYTGLKDKNGVKIYEGDILKDDENEGTEIVVVFENGSFCLEFSGITGAFMEYGYDETAGGFNTFECMPMAEYEISEMEVEGNIHDNQKLFRNTI